MSSDDSFDPFAPEPTPAPEVTPLLAGSSESIVPDSGRSGSRVLPPAPQYFVISSAEVIWGSYLGILLAANTYGLLLTWFWGVAIVLTSGMVDLSGIVCCGSFLTVLVASFLSTVLSLIAISLVSLFNFSLGSIWHPITASAIAGGFTGFGCTCGLLFNPVPDWSWLAWGYVLGPILAMVFGQLGAMIFATKTIRNFYAEQQVRVSKFVKEDPKGLQQFGIKQLLILTAWMAGLSAILSAVYRISEVALIPIVILSYFFAQILTFYFCRLILGRWIRRQLQRVAHANKDHYL